MARQSFVPSRAPADPPLARTLHLDHPQVYARQLYCEFYDLKDVVNHKSVSSIIFQFGEKLLFFCRSS
ncbi:hypothetical protein AVEN_26495-1 [Araneus ventricosus]|uniref:Uncharacterized protein n=1 Tax=Araneus ventricosus TaxID=182803 RepID=A0A4Y2CUF3_ARAVE|nr:hypothetical protein AVEN_26495-1 [Araneus ventricosus]